MKHDEDSTHDIATKQMLHTFVTPKKVAHKNVIGDLNKITIKFERKRII